MRFRGVTTRFWVVTGVFAGIYALFGFWLSGNGTVEEWLYRLGLTFGALAPLGYAGIYTWFGFSSRKPQTQWWKNPLGTAFVIAAMSLDLVFGPLAYVFWFSGGILTATWLAWTEVSGPAVSALAWTWVGCLWVRIRLAELRINDGAQEVTQPSPTIES